MCWHCDKNKFQMQMTEKDVEVYKILYKDKEGNLVSPVYERFPWQLEFLYTSFLSIKLTWYKGDYEFQGNEGLHSYMRKPQYHPSTEEYTYNRKFKCNTHYPTGGLLVKCIIPKGRFFCVNEDEEVISDALKVIEIINE
jgi:hypothetical protein